MSEDKKIDFSVYEQKDVKIELKEGRMSAFGILPGSFV
jgi:hypothetical protein